MILKISTIEMFAFHFLPVQEKKGQHLEKISSPSFALSRSHCGRSTRGLWRSAALSKSSAASPLPGGETEAAAADREMLRMLDSPTDFSLKKDNRASSPAPKSNGEEF